MAQLKRRDEAIAAYKTALSLNSYRWTSYVGLAWIYNVEHHYKEAIFEYEKALRLGEDINVRASLCSLYHFEGQHRRAVAARAGILSARITWRSCGMHRLNS